MTNAVVKKNEVNLPQINSLSSELIGKLTEALGAPRDILATDGQIAHAWNNLPRLLTRIPSELRNEGMVKMCVAVASGLFDSAINYAWNAAIIELRSKVRRFGIHIIPQIIDSKFDEKKLLEQTDFDLLVLCLKLNLISVHGYFMLDQCRDIRNNFSSAHPTIGALDEDEFVNFVNRVAKYALNNEQNPQAVDIQELIKSLNAGAFSDDQYRVWCERLENTFEAQREAIFGMLHGLYCDPSKGQETRVNAITICQKLPQKITPNISSDLINRHQDYQAKGETERHKASQAFFQNLGLLGFLSEAERHTIISNACKSLITVHNSFNNFYNELPFAERLYVLTENQAIPPTVQPEFVDTVVTCSVGNHYGTSDAADVRYYQKMIQSFTPKEIQLALELSDGTNLVAQRIKASGRCKSQFSRIVALLNPASIPTQVKSTYYEWMKVAQGISVA